MKNILTDRTFWQKYWESKSNLIVDIKPNYLFHELFSKIIHQRKVVSAIELGGFPGYYSIFLNKYFSIRTTLLDFFIHKEILSNVAQANDVKVTDIATIETDLFNYVPQEQYDLVFSCGLIEHFRDTKDIINKHIPFMKPNSMLLITLPNFKSVNGWFQRKFDIENYNKHHIDCMDPDFLTQLAKELGLKEISCRYYGGFSIWLENINEQSVVVRSFLLITWFFGKIINKLLPFEHKLFSPYIVLLAKS